MRCFYCWKTAEKSKEKDSTDDFYEATLIVKGIITTVEMKLIFIFLNLNKLNEIIEDETKIDSIECSIEGITELDNLAKEINSKIPNIFGTAVGE